MSDYGDRDRNRDQDRYGIRTSDRYDRGDRYDRSYDRSYERGDRDRYDYSAGNRPRGIPDEGPCIRCNLQIEGSGVNADDVAIDAGDASKGDGGPNGVGTVKDVAIRADRADGFVLRNVTVRHAAEHGIYVLESDGYILDRFKAYPVLNIGLTIGF